jgi:protocatechuate 3,4-dioxygenase beta subunit
MIDRKTMLKCLTIAGGGVLVARCGGGGSATTPAAAATASASSTTSNAACAVTPEGEIGPYFTDDSATGYNRSNILANLDGTQVQSGIPFSLTVIVRDSENSCAALAGAQVDIWHCNAAGVYSNESVEATAGQQWLRGYQLTNAAGTVTFTTILPGWYSGRTTHVHLRVRSSYSEASSTSDGTNTTQVFFDQALIDTLSTSVSPYDDEGINSTTNALDRVYAQQTAGKNLLTLTGSMSAGYAATFTVDLPITS